MRKNQMTTVVNYNILNVFGNSPDRSGRSSTGHSDRKQKTAEDEIVIDVTPFSRVMSGGKTDDRRIVKFPQNVDRQARAYATPVSNNDTYNRRGHAVPFIPPKGMNVDFVV